MILAPRLLFLELCSLARLWHIAKLAHYRAQKNYPGVPIGLPQPAQRSTHLVIAYSSRITVAANQLNYDHASCPPPDARGPTNDATRC